jgi:hypothetical protein
VNHKLYFYYVAFVQFSNGASFIRKQDWVTTDPRTRLYLQEDIDIVNTAPGRPPNDGEYCIRAEGHFDFSAIDDRMVITCAVTYHEWMETLPEIVQSFINPQPQRPIFFDVEYDYSHQKDPA